jgi:pyruvate formate-lyase/glycerol dehydratase family glycyl radical enzyme
MTLHQPSARIQVLKQKTREGASERMFTQRREIYERVFRENRSEPQVLRMALALAAFLREKDIILYVEDLLAGHEQFYDFELSSGCVPPPAIEEAECLDTEEFLRGYKIGLFYGGLGGHVIAGYERVLSLGFGALANQARDRLTRAFGRERDFARASLVVCEAAYAYALRYAQTAQELASQTEITMASVKVIAQKPSDHPEPVEGDRTVSEQSLTYVNDLRRIADACTWVATNTPRNLFEALQLLWLTHEIITCEQSCGSLSLGRVDQYLYPYYQRDLAAGMLTRAEASELIDAFWVKLNGIKRGFQHVALGGCGSDGAYAANDLTYFCLQATRKLGMDQPLMSVRWGRDIPAAVWDEILDLIQTGMGFPALFNDEVAIAAKQRLGVTKVDAMNYGVVGCVELSVPGKEFSHTEGIRISWAKVLELMLNDGVCPVTGERTRLAQSHDLACIKTFDEFYLWYRLELGHFLDLAVRGHNWLDRAFPKRWPYPFLSSTMEGCLEAGRDVTEGSTVYNFSTVNGCGMANAVDGLAAIQKLVFQEQKVTLSALAEALHTDFAQAMPLQKALLGCPKYGNDIPGPDEMMRNLVELVCCQIDQVRNPRNGRFQAGMYTVETHTFMGKLTGALPDGRRRGFALANGHSPAQGADISGPTAVIKSATRYDHRLLGNGMVLDLKFHPMFFKDPDALHAFRRLVETYFMLGGMEIQFNVVSRETLLAAQLDPWSYRDLLVRVSGFSAYFVDLDKLTQDEIIARVEHNQ